MPKKSAGSSAVVDPKVSKAPVEGATTEATASPPAAGAAEGSKPVKQKAKKKPPANVEREVKHPSIEVLKATGEDALTLQKAMDLIGWKEYESEDEGCVPELYSLTKKHVRLVYNPSNRWLTPGWLLELKQEILNRRWAFNGESIVVGEYGNLLSGQHRLLAFILAELERQGVSLKKAEDKAKHWSEVWDSPITLETIIVYGVKETDDVFRTLNCGKKSSLAEVLYRSTYFQNLGIKDRRNLSKLADWAVKLLWHRTGLENDPWAPRQTHGEAMDFIAHHQKIIECVESVAREYGDRATPKKTAMAGVASLGERPVWKIISPGNAAAMLYLMAASATEGESYWNADPRSEGTARKPLINFDRWDKARQFWIDLNLQGGASKEYMDPVREAIGRLGDIDPDTGKQVRGGTLREKLHVLASAWHYYLAGDEFTAEDLRPRWEYDAKKNKHTHIKDEATFGGIDKGEPSSEEDEEGEPSPVEAADPDRTAKMEEQKAKNEVHRQKLLEEAKRRREARKAGVTTAEMPNGEEPGEEDDPTDDELDAMSEAESQEEGAGNVG